MGINRAFLSGNLTNDAQLRSTQSGMAILEFGLAVNDRHKNQQTGEWEERPNYFNCKIFGRRGEALSNILAKGMPVSIEGHLQWSSWEDKNTGQRRSKIEVVVDELVLMSQRQGNAPQSAPQPQYAAQHQRGYANPPQQQMAPQMAPQAPAAPVPPQGYGYQQQMPQAAPQMTVYDEDIPF